MDRSWIDANRFSKEYSEGMQSFFEFAQRNVKEGSSNSVLRCPCSKCVCTNFLGVKDVKVHLMVNGFDKGYRTWYWHGEKTKSNFEFGTRGGNNVKGSTLDDESVLGDRIDDLIDDVRGDVGDEPEIIGKLLENSEKPLYPNCDKHTVLSAVLKLFSLKASHGWSDKGFTDLLKVVKELLPKDNELPRRIYDAKKILCPLGLGYKKIHACPNDCMIYTNEFAELYECVKCGESRYKKKNVPDSEDDVLVKSPPAKVFWYLPIIPRLQRLFAKSDEARNLTWYATRKCDGKLRHPADSPQWKMIDEKFSDFGGEERNIRFGLCTDGINPHGDLSSRHSAWPVMLVIYNLPPWLSMKRKYVMLSLMISGPRQPGNDIDVYLRPLIDDLKLLWNEGVNVFDAYRKENFLLRAMVFCTINDFPAYGNLSGYTVKGHKACPICEDDTSFVQLKHGKKTVFLGHRKFLSRYHPYRGKKKAFNGRTENEILSGEPLSGDEVFNKVRNLGDNYGKINGKNAPRAEKSPWKKCSIFFELPYWKELFVRHSLDVMHIEKNICDSLLGTLLNIPGKTKDGLNSRLDLIEMGIRPELAPQVKGKRTYLPPAMHTLSKQEKHKFCKCLYETKVPQGFSSNIRSLVSMSDLKLIGLKSHDCHILMQHMIPIAIRSLLPHHVRIAITNLCLCFRKICSHTLDVQDLNFLQEKIVETLCQLEMYFPPSFFDIMVHLSVHIVREIRLCGPVSFRWMYPHERAMKVFKGYVRNRFRPEASIVENYVTEEILDFVNDYLSEVGCSGISKRVENEYGGSGTCGMKIERRSTDEVMQAHLYILNNEDEVEPFIEEHKGIIDDIFGHKNNMWRVIEHNRSFIKWFQTKIQSDSTASNRLQWISKTPSYMVFTYSAYEINGYTFYTEAKDERTTYQNSGVCLTAKAIHFSSSRDLNPVSALLAYYGVIQEIWEVDFGQFRVPVFKCKWFDSGKNGTIVDDLGFTLVNFNRHSHANEPFVLASQVKQVFYIKDPNCTLRSDWRVVIDGRRKLIPEEFDSDDDALEIGVNGEIETIDEDDENYLCTRERVEGIWVESISNIRSEG